MGNDVAKTSAGGALAAIKGLKQNLAKVKAAIPAAGGLGYLRFLTDGSWVFGQDNKELEAYDAKKERSDRNFGDEVAFNPMSIKIGFTCWTDYPASDKRKNENLGEVLVPLGADVPLKHEMRDTGWEWKEVVVLEGVIMSGKYEGTPVKYTASSKGGLTMANAIIEQVMQQLDVSEELIVPVVELGADHYPHKQWGKTYVPAFSVVDFVTMDGLSPATAPESEPEDEPEVAPARTRATRTPEPAPAPEEVEEAEVVEEQPAADTAVRRRRR